RPSSPPLSAHGSAAAQPSCFRALRQCCDLLLLPIRRLEYLALELPQSRAGEMRKLTIKLRVKHMVLVKHTAILCDAIQFLSQCTKAFSVDTMTVRRTYHVRPCSMNRR